MQTFIVVFCRGSSVILFFTGLVKLITILGEDTLLSRPNLVFAFLSNRQVFFVAATLELAIARNLLLHRGNVMKLRLTACLSTLLVAYRFWLWLVGYNGSCHCLDTFKGNLRIDPGLAQVLTNILLLYLLLTRRSLRPIRRFGA